MTYRVEALKLDEGKLHVARQIPEVKNYNGDMERPPDIGRDELLVSAETRVWKGEKPAKLTDLALGDALLVNLTGEQHGHAIPLHRYLGRDGHAQARYRTAKQEARAGQEIELERA